MASERLIITPTKSEFRSQEFTVIGEMPPSFRGSRVVFATSEEGVKVVVKIPATWQGAEREWTGLIKNSQAGIPVPAPIILGLTDSGRPCVVLERLYGKPLFLYHNDEARAQLGQNVRQMHSRVEIGGFEWQQSGMADFSYYERKVKMWGRVQGQNGDDNSTTQHLFQSLSLPMIDYCVSTKPVFNHNDLHDGQVIKLDNKKLSIIDFGDWTEDRPLNDLGYYLFHCLRTSREFENFKSFMTGYLEGQSLSENEKQALIYNLLFISTRAIIKFLTYKVDYLETARATHQRVLKFIDQETLWKIL